MSWLAFHCDATVAPNYRVVVAAVTPDDGVVVAAVAPHYGVVIAGVAPDDSIVIAGIAPHDRVVVVTCRPCGGGAVVAAARGSPHDVPPVRAGRRAGKIVPLIRRVSPRDGCRPCIRRRCQVPSAPTVIAPDDLSAPACLVGKRARLPGEEGR